MLPLGRKNSRKCSECDITCHANCAHLVPDFCGMSMETANELLRNWRDINQQRSKAQPNRPAGRQYNETSHTTSPSLDSTMDRLKLGGPEVGPPSIDPYGRPTPASPPSDRYPSQDPRLYQPSSPPQQQQQILQPYGQPARPPPGARVPIPLVYPQDPTSNRAPNQYDAVPPAQGDQGYGPGGYPVSKMPTLYSSLYFH